MADSQANRLLADIKRLLVSNNKSLCQLVDKPQEDPVDPVLYCNILDGECNVTGAQILIRDEETGALTIIYLDANFEVTTIPPIGTPCDAACGNVYDLKILPPICYEDEFDNKWQLVLCLSYINGILIEQTEIWMSPTGEVFETPPAGLTPCDVDCAPAIQEFDLSETVSSYIPFTNITVYTTGCCTVTIDTSAGTFRVRPNTKVFSSTQFGCDVVLNSITFTGNCEPEDIVVYLEHKGCSNCNV